MSYIAEFKQKVGAIVGENNPVFMSTAKKLLGVLRNKRINPQTFKARSVMFLLIALVNKITLRKLGTSQKELQALAKARGLKIKFADPKSTTKTVEVGSLVPELFNLFPNI